MKTIRRMSHSNIQLFAEKMSFSSPFTLADGYETCIFGYSFITTENGYRSFNIKLVDIRQKSCDFGAKGIRSSYSVNWNCSW